MRFTFDLDGIDDMEKAFGGTEIELNATCRKAVEKGLDRGVVVARTQHAYTDRTGNLTRSIRPKFEPRREDLIEGQLLAEAKYASFVEGGTRPHPIKARNAPFLVFRWNGHLVRKKRVNHPGTKPFPFMGPAYLAMERKMIEVIELGIASFQRFFNG